MHNQQATKLSPFSLKRPTRPVKHVVLEDPLQPGAILEIHLRAMDAVDFHKQEAIAQEAMMKYLGPDAEPLPILQGDPIEATVPLISSAAGLCVMQVGAPEELYTLTEWIGIAATMPNVWNSLGAICDSLTKEGPLGKSLERLTTGSSDSLSPTPSSTPSPSLEQTPSSGPSTSDSEPLQGYSEPQLQE